ncbi:EMBRYO SURROUNDING FACTOR 1-like protein 8 [Raphanus sativus]|uniref:EMBRYO SURROUNDING FACTOR 1-like protein 8 n=1 Tax=Raphanus sativus TaxID=3726 RepID=A0A9W3DTQ9_RAPSA|nr:EMBRYO SURROUNDING FACTOR 1-like protein 8 [Raphanus sativus]
MSSSQFAIFCIILIALFPLHEFVDGQGTCKQTPCPNAKDKNKTCFCCPSNNRCYATKDTCAGWCGKQ